MTQKSEDAVGESVTSLAQRYISKGHCDRMNDQHLLSLAESYLQKSVFPHDAAIDGDVDAL